MEFLKLCCVAPHPPIIIPEIGGSELKKLEKSTSGLKELARDIESARPETLVVMSPHSPIFSNAFALLASRKPRGSFAQFGAGRVGFEFETDLQFLGELQRCADESDVPVTASDGKTLLARGGELDHGVLVPLYYLAPEECKLVTIALSLLDYREHYRLGMVIRETAERVGRSVVFIASGDLSHRLIPGAPAGYSPRGEEFDGQIVEIMNSGDYRELFELDPDLIEEAGECGLRPIFTLAGTVDGFSVDSKVLSYEGPFGVGYMVARVRPVEPDSGRSITIAP